MRLTLSLFEIFKNKSYSYGHTGFKGSWLVTWLNLLGSQVVGISNGVPSNPVIMRQLLLTA